MNTSTVYQPDMFRRETAWIINEGKRMPVRKDSYVEVIYRDGFVCRGVWNYQFEWGHDSGNADIMQFRILEGKKA